MKKRKNLKGFTLIELIIVMAIFGILMVAVMQVITPLNKLSKRASIQEANAAVVDNMKAYLEGTLRYADCVEVFNGGLTDNDGNLFSEMTSNEISEKQGVLSHDNSLSVSYTPEQAAVSQFIDNHYTNRLNPGTDDPLSGKVRMLKIDNKNGGVVTEYEFDFNAGYTYTHFGGDKDADGNLIDVTKRVNTTVNASKVGSKEVFNPVYYDDYSFYFVPGYNETIIQSDTSLIDRDPDAFKNDNPEDYYVSIEKVKTASGNVYADFTPDMFSFSVMAYKNDTDDANNPYIMNLKDDAATTEDESLISVFKSPFALSNINMSLVNINSVFSQQNTNDMFGAVRYKGSSADGDGNEGRPVAGMNYSPEVPVKNGSKTVFRELEVADAPLLNKRLCSHGEVEAAKNDGCIYIIYTLPEYK